MALTLGAFVVSMVEHDRMVAAEAFESGLGVSPSSALTYLLGSCALSWRGEAERPIEWGERGLRLSPHDRLAFMAWVGISLGRFQQERYAEAIDAARRAIQSEPRVEYAPRGLHGGVGEVEAPRRGTSSRENVCLHFSPT
jgi:hypothetical protein